MNAILPKNIVENLHSIRFIGNIAAHELTASDTKELKLAIEICEDLMNFLYELDYKSSLLIQIHQKKAKRKTIKNKTFPVIFTHSELITGILTKRAAQAEQRLPLLLLCSLKDG